MLHHLPHELESTDALLRLDLRQIVHPFVGCPVDAVTSGGLVEQRQRGNGF